MDIRSIKSVRVLKRSIDARQRTVMVNLKVRVYIDEFPQDDEFPVSSMAMFRVSLGRLSGGWPAGLFAALRLIELGICPVVVERGKNVHDRRKDIALISREQRVDPESNYSFGEGEPERFPTVNSILAVRSGEVSSVFFKFLSARGIGFNPF